MLKLLPDQIQEMEEARRRRFNRAVWEAWNETVGQRCPPLEEGEALSLIDAITRFCQASAFEEPSHIARAAIYALVARSRGYDAEFVMGMLLFLVQRNLATEESFTWIDHVLSEGDHGR